MKKNIIVFILLTVCILLSDYAGAELTLSVNHSDISVDWNYHGSSVSLKGKTDPDLDLVAVISSENVSQKLKKKGRVGGILWMNTGDLHLDNLPDVYFLKSSKALDEILPKEEMERYGIGYDALRQKADITPVSGEKEKHELFNEFVRYKENSKHYSSSTADFAMTENDGGRFYTHIEWPYQVQPGQYKARVYAVKNHKVVDQAEAEVNVELTGIVAKLTDLAWNNAALYGIFAIITALVTGFVAGFVFKQSGGAH